VVPPRSLDDGDRERLVEAARLTAIGRLVGSVAHRLSTPLAAISLRAESLGRAVEGLGESDLLAKVRRHSSAIQDEAFRCKELLSTLQLFARPPRSAADRVDLNSLCQEAVRLVHHEAMGRQVKVESRLAESLEPIPGDETHLGQVVVALLLNAVEASPDGSVVTVETIAEEGAVTVAITDQGQGVPASVEGRLFEPFVSSRPPPAGAGLGLMASRAIAAAHDGAISWRHGADAGTRFALTIPRRPGSGP
jgi:C4-dicarboxylate-specific signal transduction histidine kinase